MTVERVTVTRLGQRGEGVADGSGGTLYVPYVLPGETALVDVDGDVGHRIELLAARPDRIAPICPYFERCGGCAVQSLPDEPYAAWKHGLVVHALHKAGIETAVDPLIVAHGRGRRRATFHARAPASPNLLQPAAMKVGFMRARAHEVIEIADCPILSSAMAPALPAARRLASTLQSLQKPLDLVVTATDTGLDVDLRGLGPLEPRWLQVLADAAAVLDLARVANHGDVILERRAPVLTMGKAKVVLPPGAFLQATMRGEAELVRLVVEAVGDAKRVADLFCGIGTFALRLAERATVRAIDMDGPPLQALSRAARSAPVLRPVATEARDLFRRPLSAQDLASCDAVVFDPPRAGAAAQAEALANSTVATVVAVSCNPSTLARDAALLVQGGYRLERVTPVDQFLYSSHVEVVAVFRRKRERKQGRRALLG